MQQQSVVGQKWQLSAVFTDTRVPNNKYTDYNLLLTAAQLLIIDI